MGRWTSYDVIKLIITTKVDYQNSCRGIDVPAANIEYILHYFDCKVIAFFCQNRKVIKGSRVVTK